MAGSGKGPLRIAIEDFFETFQPGEWIHNWIVDISDRLEDGAFEIYEEWVDLLGMDDFLIEELKPRSVKAHKHPIPAALLAIGGMLVGGIGAAIIGSLSPFARLITYRVERTAKSARPDPSSAWAMIRRHSGSADELKTALRDQGWSEEMIAMWDTISQPIISAHELTTLHRKLELSDTDYRAAMSALGWTTERADQLQELHDLIPGPIDLVRMAVREAFDPDVVSQYGYGQNFPTPFAEWMDKQGYSREWAEKYWYAHWTLPGLRDGYEMFHRLRPGIGEETFTSDDLDLLMRLQDVAPYFRSKLKAISYRPLTRVDVRRMYKMGVLTEAEVKNSYLDLGYNDRNADLMTDFTTRFESTDERDLTRASIQMSYKRSLISRSEASQYLVDIGYNQDRADFYLDITDYDLQAQETDEALAMIRQQYIAGILDESTVYDKIGKFNLPSERLQALLQLWTVQRESRINTPSRSELDDLYRRNLITTDDYQQYMQREGYQSEVIILFTQRVDMIMQDEAEYEAERAQKEQERIQRARLSTDYQKDKAGINVQIATVNLAIADLKVARYQTKDVELISEIKIRIAEANAIIKQLRLNKSQLTYEYRA